MRSERYIIEIYKNMSMRRLLYITQEIEDVTLPANITRQNNCQLTPSIYRASDAAHIIRASCKGR